MAQKVRAIFLSDIHLGTRGCQADRLLDFLRGYESEYLFLVGDIIDFWAMSRGICWTAEQNTVVQKLLRRARHGEHVMLVPGNHDEALREYDGISFGNIQVVNEYVHIAADGRRYLLIHGDEFDQVTRHHRWVAVLGDVAYNWLVRINGVLSWVRRRLNRPGYWSLAGYAKRRVKTAVSFIFDFEDSVIRHAKERGMDGVICGHIHAAIIRDAEGVVYINCGDWVDSCTAIVEHLDGRMELLHQGDLLKRVKAESAPAMVAARHISLPGQAVASWNWIKLRPASLARYIAMSTRSRITSMLASWSTNKVTPRLAVRRYWTMVSMSPCCWCSSTWFIGLFRGS